MRPAFLLLLLSLSACHGDDDCDGCGGGVPVYLESERNDDPLTANDFGTLRPGDHFFIDGFVRDDVNDPFDGFAFTAGEALHVDFQLFIGNAAADLDVCLYDPQIDQTVACFATSDDPEQGGVDVFAGGLSFHLVVESFVGDASYSLEIVVQSLFARAPLAPDGALVAGASARAEHASAAAQGYRRARPEPRVVLEHSAHYDPASDTLLEIVHLRRL